MTEQPHPDKTLELFGQQASAGVITPFVFCYRRPDAQDPALLIDKLERGLVTLARAFPWTAGRVVKVESDDGLGSGVFKIRHTSRPPRVITNDLRSSSLLDMEQFIESGCPCSSLPESIFSPYDVLPGKPDQVDARSAVMNLQANIVRGGLILTLVGHHQVLDGTGQDQVAYWLDKACRAEAFTEEELEIGNMDREHIISPFPDSWQTPRDSRYLKQHSTGDEPSATQTKDTDTVPNDTPSAEWTDIIFPSSSLLEMKVEANRQLESGFVSTDDALTSLIWQALARARSDRLAGDAVSTMGRAINPRRYLGIPATYPGYISNMAFSTRSLDWLSTASLGTIARELRKAVDPITCDLSESTRELATLIHRAEDKDSVSLTSALNMKTDVMMSSWAGMRCGRFEFDLGLGPPIAVRRTLMPPVPGLMFLLPRGLDGEVVLHICARSDELERMKADPAFNKYARM